MLLDVPPRFMWGWGPGVSGYCGSMTIQTMALYYGSYLSQDSVRGATGGHDGTHEIELGRGGCCAAVDIMPKFSLNVSQWKFWSAPHPQAMAFLQWLKAGVAAGEPAAFGVYMETEDNPGFDHIVPLVGFDDDVAGMGERLVFNDLHANMSLREPISTFIASRHDCRKKLPWKHRFQYCLPANVSYGLRVHGNADADGVLAPAKLVMDEWSEPDYSHEDGKGEAPRMLGAWLVVSKLRPGAAYSILEYADASRVPSSDFLSNRTGGVVSRVDFFAGSTATTHRQRVYFMSNSTTFYRVLRHASNATTNGNAQPARPGARSGVRRASEWHTA